MTKGDFAFVNVADTTIQGFIRFGSMPAINNAGAVAFNADGTSFVLGAVFKWEHNTLTTIASSAGGVLRNFGDSVAVNPAGLVAFSANVATGGSIIASGNDRGMLTTIVDANTQGIVGGAFLGVSAMNTPGRVAFVAFRRGFGSQAIFDGNGGPLRVLVDTSTSSFTSLGAAATNASGDVAFRGFLADGSGGIFRGTYGSTVVADTNNPNFLDFLDPVINNAGTVASAVFLNTGGAQVFSSRDGGITTRTNPAGRLFSFVDNVSINNSGDVAFFGADAIGGHGIFLEATGRDSPVAVIEAGDKLFGSTVTRVNVGRFSLNDRDHISFQYTLADGRSGIAVAYPRNESSR